MVRDKIVSIFENVQETSTCHRKYLQVLSKLYHKTPFEDFYSDFSHIVITIFIHPLENNEFILRGLTFAAKFCAEIAKKEEDENETHPLLFRIFHESLEHTNSAVLELRYYTCKFIMLVLQYIKDGVSLDNELCDDICKKMLPRLHDPKVDIRIQAISSLVRLQDPSNPDCPVIAAYKVAMVDPNANVRKEATKSIAPNPSSLVKLRERICDTDKSIRSVAYQRCGDVGPFNFKIVDRHLILNGGFQEEVESVRNTFVDCLLNKWLTAYKGSYLAFIKALKLSPHEDDMNNLTYMVENLLKIFCTRKSLDDVVHELLIEDRVVPHKSLTDVVALYWRICSQILRKSNKEDKLEDIIPDLSLFCQYLEQFIEEQSRNKLDEWQLMEHQFILYNLFVMANDYDLSDEVGRRNLNKLVLSLLAAHNFSRKLTKKLVEIAEKCTRDTNAFVVSMCGVISDLQEEETTQEPAMNELQRMDHKFEVDKLETQIICLKDSQVDAIESKDYQRAHEIDLELAESNKKLEELTKSDSAKAEVVRVAKTDSKTICWCLNILIGVLELPNVKSLSPALATIKVEFVVPLIQRDDGDIHWRVLRCLTLLSLIDRTTAEEYAKILSIPIATYRTMPCHDTKALIESIYAVTDLMLMHGPSIICDDESSVSAASKRRLYSNDDDVSESSNVSSVTLSTMYEMLMDLMDDEDGMIRKKVASSIKKLVINGFSISPSLLSRIIIKWYSPAKSNDDKELQMILGDLFQRHIIMEKQIAVFQESIFPTLLTLIQAPKTSPLVEIDIDNVLHFFSSFINIQGKKDHARILALDILMKIEENTEDRMVPTLLKLLNMLQIPKDNPDAVDELTTRAEALLEDIDEKTARKRLLKFIGIVKSISSSNLTATTNATIENSTNNNSVANDSTSTANNRGNGSLSRRSSTKSSLPKSHRHTDEVLIQGGCKRKSSVVENSNSSKRRVCTRSSSGSGSFSSLPQAESTQSEILIDKTNTKKTNSSNTQVKRRKGRNNGKDLKPVVVVERFDSSKTKEPVLHTILETSMERMILNDDMTIQTPSTSNTPEHSPRNQVVVSETSDAESFSTGSGSSRRSRRIRKKRIISD